MNSPSTMSNPETTTAPVTYLAFQVPPRGEPIHRSLELMMEACSQAKVFFREIETLGYLPSKNGTQVLRVRLDLDASKLPALEAALNTMDRGTIFFRDGVYSSPKLGTVSISQMLTVPNPACHLKLRGTKYKEWRRQFTKG